MGEKLPPAANRFLNMLKTSRHTETDEGNHSDEYESSFGAQSNPQTTMGTNTFSASVVQNPKDIAIFGKFDPMAKSDYRFQIIEKYVHNSHGLQQGGDVKVHQIYELSGKWVKDAWNSLIYKMKPNTAKNKEDSEQMLLWFKTTPAEIKRLAQGQDGCVAFYDRLSRAFTENPARLQAPLHQIFVLCVISLGKNVTDRNGFQKWSQIGQAPAGYDTVKGIGRVCPDWKENDYENLVTIPCGPSVAHGRYRKYELDYNEYIVFESRRIQVKYAVECDIIPAALMPKSGLGTIPVNSTSKSEDVEVIADAKRNTDSSSLNNFAKPNQAANLLAALPNIPSKTVTRSHQQSGTSTRTTTNLYKTSSFRSPKSAAPGSSTGQPLPVASLFNRNFPSRSSNGHKNSFTVPHQQTVRASQYTKNKIEQAALQELMQLPGASATAFKKCLYKAQIITHADEVHDLIHSYVKNGSVHGYGMKILNIIRIVRDNDLEFQHDPKMKGKQRMMLWHGTKESVVAGILQAGFKIPTAKNQMFGMGIYFADRASKSANYCDSTKKPKKGKIAYLFLCDVAIGTHYNSKNAKNNYTAPPTITTKAGATKHFDSLKCTGTYIPNESEKVDFYGSIFPLGKTVTNTKYLNCTVQYNEYIVYNSSQVKIKYLVKVELT